MKDVAKEAGVSLGTVSKVFNGITVGEDYKKRVLDASGKLNYQVNTYARGLKTNKTRNIALLIPSLRHPFYAALADEITASLIRRDHHTILMTTNYDAEAEQKTLTMARQNKVDGIIGLTYHPNLTLDDSIPFVTIDRHFNAGIPCVSSDNFGGGEIAANKLIELGCKKLLFMRIGSDIYGEVNKRQAGFENVCKFNDIEHDSIILSDHGSEQPFFDYLDEHTDKNGLYFDGIFCNSDQIASHVCEYLMEKGIKIPEDVQVIGYDGIKDHFTGRYTCSTIVQPISDMAEAAVDIILKGSDNLQSALVSLPVHYVPGGTTKE